MDITNDGPKVKGLLNFGSIQHGEAVRFDLLLDDKQVIPYHADYSNLGTIVSQFVAAGQMAEAARRRRGPLTSEDLTTAYTVVNTRTGVFAHGTIAAMFSTTLGPPVTMQLSLDLARKLITDLQTSLLQAARESGPKRN